MISILVGSQVVAAAAALVGANEIIDGAADVVMLHDDPNASLRSEINQLARIIIGGLGVYGGCVMKTAPLASKICVALHSVLGTTRISLTKTDVEKVKLIINLMAIAGSQGAEVLEEFPNALNNALVISNYSKIGALTLQFFVNPLYAALKARFIRRGIPQTNLERLENFYTSIMQHILRNGTENEETNLQAAIISLSLGDITPDNFLNMQQIPEELQNDPMLLPIRCTLSNRTVRFAVTIRGTNQRLFDRTALLDRIRQNPNNIIPGRVVNEADIEPLDDVQGLIDRRLNQIRDMMITIRGLIGLSVRIHYHQLLILGEIPNELRRDPVLSEHICPHTQRPIRFAARISGEPQVYESTALVSHSQLANRVTADKAHMQALHFYEKATDIQQMINTHLLACSKIMAMIQNEEYVEDWRYNLSRHVLSSFESLIDDFLRRETQLTVFLNRKQAQHPENEEITLREEIGEDIIKIAIAKSKYEETVPSVYVALPLLGLINHYFLDRPSEEVETIERKYFGRELRPKIADIERLFRRMLRR
ncbi:MAG: hypothetical protein HZB76_02860 [Chlamydiae bacterium]|nr:hypothetical protein [Chlamydiota bacterium]